MVCVSMSKILTAASRSPSLQRESCRPILQFHPTAKRWQPSAQTVKCIPIRSRAESLAPYRAPVSGSGQLVGARMAASCIYIRMANYPAEYIGSTPPPVRGSCQRKSCLPMLRESQTPVPSSSRPTALPMSTATTGLSLTSTSSKDSDKEQPTVFWIKCGVQLKSPASIWRPKPAILEGDFSNLAA